MEKNIEKNGQKLKQRITSLLTLAWVLFSVCLWERGGEIKKERFSSSVADKSEVRSWGKWREWPVSKTSERNECVQSVRADWPQEGPVVLWIEAGRVACFALIGRRLSRRLCWVFIETFRLHDVPVSSALTFMFNAAVISPCWSFLGQNNETLIPPRMQGCSSVDLWPPCRCNKMVLHQKLVTWKNAASFPHKLTSGSNERDSVSLIPLWTLSCHVGGGTDGGQSVHSYRGLWQECETTSSGFTVLPNLSQPRPPR